MKYFYDTEFLEGTQKSFFGQSKPTIDLISIGIVCEDGREYYAVSKDFNLKEAWNRYDLKREQVYGDMRNQFPNGITKKVYWIRENVLKPIYYGWIGKDINYHEVNFTYDDFKRLLKKYGKTNKQIAKEVYDFVNPDLGFHVTAYSNSELKKGGKLYNYFNEHNVASDGNYFFSQPKLYGYYSAYDHVALCWLFGKMIDLPKGFPMYTRDLKQMIDLEGEKSKLNSKERLSEMGFDNYHDFLKTHPGYPKQSNEHNALDDAKWNKKLYDFINVL